MRFLTLGIETSCDETAISVVEGDRKVLSNAVSSSVHLHRKFGGVVPEIACRYHVEYIMSVLQKALSDAGVGLKDIDLISVTNGPGLSGALLVGISFAKSLSFALNAPLIGVNHLHAHLWAAVITNKDLKFPFMGLVVSGGHTSLAYCKSFNDYKIIGQTRDDAAGEAFDKVSKILRLGYPGGPAIEKVSSRGNLGKMRLPKTRLKGNPFDFSFSGIKTAVLYYIREKNPGISRYDIAASFQENVVDELVERSLAACVEKNVKSLAIGGGVSANKRLREKLAEEAKKQNIKVFFPQMRFCVDNAAMVAGLGAKLYKSGKRSDLSLQAEPNLGF